jgi:hypothetical protein
MKRERLGHGIYSDGRRRITAKKPDAQLIVCYSPQSLGYSGFWSLYNHHAYEL